MTQMELEGWNEVIKKHQTGEVSQSLDRGVPFESDELPPNNKLIVLKWLWEWDWSTDTDGDDIRKRIQELIDAEE